MKILEEKIKESLNPNMINTNLYIPDLRKPYIPDLRKPYIPDPRNYFLEFLNKLSKRSSV